MVSLRAAWRTLALAGLAGLGLAAQTLTLTFDDGPNRVRTPLLSPETRNAAILKALGDAKVQAIVFANGIDGGDTPEGRAALAAWGRAGHLVGNHTYSHLRLADLAAFEADVQRCDALIRGIPGYTKLFRFPYLKEGATLETRDGMRKALAEAGYRNAHVTIPTFDWLIDEHLRTRLKADPQASLEPYRTYYVEDVLDQADRARALALKLTGREVKHAVLLHHCLLNALFLGELIHALRANGWTLVGPLEAYADPIYQQAPRTLDTGTSLLRTLAAERGLLPGRAEGLEAAYARERERLREAGL
ncbi:polysaccharide deacetylase [Geothrix rubra]|uniref:Polysaccharide deacetylase n=1 Tax=Geothrix rubra TaxID=2927977 RepID=A0ABQ5Q7A7_9BACT|nr:polysaccharide deacetylase family protein [Geothrix rubra]GLH70553.1 polysaccharide deacetylase [Geothrix rubra]